MKKTLVFGASSKPYRYSRLAIERLKASHIDTVAYGLKAGEVSRVQIKTNLSEFHNIHTVSLYLNPTRQPEFYKTIIDLRPVRVIFNPGTENPEFYRLLRNENITVEQACTLVLLTTGQY
jgi:predicted CoA-binding protein